MHTRRQFIGVVSVFTASLFEACSDDERSPAPASPDGGDAGLPPADGGQGPGSDASDGGASSDGSAADGGPAVDRLRLLRTALEGSPDHLRAQAEQAVALGDPTAIFAFVRDSIRVLPPVTDFENVETAVRYGTQSLLRSGAGTPRERAELLVELLTRAHFKASVVKGDPVGALAKSDAPKSVFTRRPSVPFRPSALPASVSRGARAPALLDPDGAEADAIAERIIAALPSAALDARTPTLQSFYGMPFVALEVAGKTTYLNTLPADAVYGESYATNIVAAAKPDRSRLVTVSLGITRARAPGEIVELVSNTYAFEDLAGARLRVSVQPTLPLPLLLRAKPDEVTTFVAGLSLFTSAGEHVKTTTGSALTPFGDVATTTKGEVTVSGVPLDKGGDVASVASVDVVASARGFPAIELEVSPKDGKGAVVAGLSASDFAIEEGGTTRVAVLRENGGTPRVLFLWDGTGSQPAATVMLGTAMGAAIFDGMPGARVQVSLLSGSPSPGGYSLTSAASVGQALVGLSDVSSPVFQGLLSALGAAPTLVVLFTDGDAEKDTGLRARALAAIATCPVVAVGCRGASGTITPGPLQAIADVSGGAYVDGGELTDPTTAAAAITAVGSRRANAPYRLAYRAATEGAAKRQVVVTAKATGKTTYTAPSTPVPASELVGLHLHLEVDGVTVDRTLAGAPIVAALAGSEDIANASEDVRDVLLGSAWITFEGAAPTLAAWLDDALGAAIGFEPVAAAVAAKDVQGAYDALAKAPSRPFLSSLLAHAPLRRLPDGAVVEVGLRAVLHTFRALTTRTTTDLLPVTRFSSIGISDTSAAFESCLRATLRLAVAEKQIAIRSTAKALAKPKLTLLAAGTLADAALPAGVPAASRASFLSVLNAYADFLRVTAADGSSLAFWAIHPSSGSVLGILPDGSGGAVEECQEIVDFAKSAMDELVALTEELEAGYGGAVAAIAAVGKAAAIAYAEAALSFTDPLIDPSIWDLGLTLLCDKAKDLIPPVLGHSEDQLTQQAIDWATSAAENEVDESDICKAVAPCTPG